MNNKDDQLSFCAKIFKTISVPLLIIVIVYIVFIGIYTSSYSEKLGIMGDFVGGMLNPLLAFLSFICLLYTIKLQIEELKLTRKELVASREAQQQSANTLSQQRFEMTFFSLLNTTNKSIETFKKELENLNKRVSNLKEEDANLIKELYIDFSFIKVAMLIYQHLKLIDNYNKNNENINLNGNTYSNILRACLDQDTLMYLAVFANKKTLSIYNIELIKKYRMFEHAIIYHEPDELYDEFIRFIVLYGDEAFGDSLEIKSALVKQHVKILKSKDNKI